MNHQIRFFRLFILTMGLLLLCRLNSFAGQNAAELYKIACDGVIKVDRARLDHLRKMVKPGWSDEGWDLKDILAANQTPIAIFKQASTLPECDFSSSLPANIFDLVHLLLFEGEMLAREGKNEQALDNFIAVLRFSGQCVRQKSVFYMNSGTIVQSKSFRVLAAFLSNKHLQPSECARLMQTLASLSSEMTPLEVLLREENKVHLRLLREANNEAVAKNPQKNNFLTAYYKDVEREFTRYSDQLTELLIRYSRTNDPAEHNAWLAEMGKWNAGSNIVSDLLMAVKIPVGKWRPENYAKMNILLGSGSYIEMIKKYFVSQSRLSVLLAGAKIRQFELLHGMTPDSLETLVGWEQLSDPFAGGKPLKFLRRGDNWLVYGIGPDLKDNKGEVTYSGETVDGLGDIVLTN